MAEKPYGKVLDGSEAAIAEAYGAFLDQPVDHDVGSEPLPGVDASVSFSDKETTIGSEFSVTGPGTFFGRAQRTLRFTPTTKRGWWFNRTDLPEQMPIRVSVNNIWTTARNIVLCSGSPHNYMRMVEHIIALKAGMGLDNVVIHMDSGDPPLFDRSSMDLVEAVERAGVASNGREAVYLTVKEPVCIGGTRGDFLLFLPAEPGAKYLDIDCGVDFKSAIGQQRIKFRVNGGTFRHGALARTNTTFGMMMYCRTIGKLFADTRNLGYTANNILIAGRRKYYNEPLLMHGSKSLEAVWHRATLDLLAAIALMDRARLAGRVVSCKAGHTLDVRMIQELYKSDLLTKVR